ncbi:MAG: UDP-N-acetylmuramate dehydrogenase [Bacteroidetes bacterium]|nr:UDP-N-acetylmuramate dehydrogenase [Bacteroidota bacterium]MBV6460882.1 UDP-N-acetylenolpyruvoylglucosamine reductase [Flavobacteriales bacterium]WKZ75719.1 MAG: UDP-N-acetylmuramate dehydrogenase [Vicingaceae bacterium]MCL4815286.1 UDP-N-acetylmuramate dehydrogenase [Flavobacteriales bacterium]NOG94628.1 UDP-N-acetylmuramate dehydrogenase [Bacteroidota bacterium]
MKIKENISLKPYNTFNIDANAMYFTELESTENIYEFIHEKKFQNIPQLILGGGSNILLTDHFDGIVLKNQLKGIRLIQETLEHYFIKASAGENWHRFVLYCIENNYAGLENLSLIPGCVGASPMQNIGAYGVEVKDLIHEVETIHLSSGQTQVFDNSSCKFDYRSSVFKTSYKNQFIITHVVFKLNKKPNYTVTYGSIEEELDKMGIKELSIRAISDAVCRIRKSKLPNPIEIGNAGSFFKNPVVPIKIAKELKEHYPDIPIYTVNSTHCKLAAGWLIEKCGWKGKTIKNCGVHTKQALVLVNYGNASGKDILELANRIIASVKDTFHIELEKEVNII